MLRDNSDTSPKSGFDAMSSSSDPLYTGKNYMDLIDMILRLSNNEEERRAAEKSERRFVEWNCFTIFMEKIEQ